MLIAAASHRPRSGNRGNSASTPPEDASLLPLSALLILMVAAFIFLLRWMGNHANRDQRGGEERPPRVDHRGGRRPTVSLFYDVISSEKGRLSVEASLIQELCKRSDMYIFAKVKSDDEERDIRRNLLNLGIVGEDNSQCGLPALLFCETDAGKIAFARQLESDIHIDSSAVTVHDLQPFVPQLLLVAPSEGMREVPPNVTILRDPTECLKLLLSLDQW